MSYKIILNKFLTITLLLSPFLSPAQNTSERKDKRKMPLEEASDDPYLPNAHNNKKTTPAYHYNSNAASRTAGATSIVTTQANVDGAGQNIVDDAANEPNIALNPVNTDEISIGWRQFDNILSNFRQAGWAFTTDGGQTWTFPGVIEPGIFHSDPVLDYDSLGNFYYNSLTSDPGPVFSCKIFRSGDGGATWDAGVDAAGGDKQWMAIDRTGDTGDGNIYSFWTSEWSICIPQMFIRSTDGGNSYENCIDVDGTPQWGTMAIGNAGELYICGMNDNFDSIIVVKSLDAYLPGSVITWSTLSTVNMDRAPGFNPAVNPVGLLGQVNIDVDRSPGPGHDNVYVLVSMIDPVTFDPGDVVFARSTDGGVTWDAPVRVNDDANTTATQWMAVMSVAPNGRIDAAWLDTRDAAAGFDASALYYSYSLDQGQTWSANELLSAFFDPHVGYPSQDKMGDYMDMISDNAGAHLAWAATFNGEQDVYYSRIIPQITGIDESSFAAGISISPNPTSGTFIIKSEIKPASIEIYSVLGEKVYSLHTPSSFNEINISQNEAGVYFLKITSGDGITSVKKLIKK
jgi:hypothetical protein